MFKPASKFSAVAFASILASALAGCQENKAIPTQPVDIFNIAQMRMLTSPIRTVAQASRATVTADMLKQAPEMARLYREALARFEGMYGDGVGPSRNRLAYRRCKAEFHRATERMAMLPLPRSDSTLDGAWASLQGCRKLAEVLSSPAEIATFGRDLEAMTEGSMLVLCYAATASELDRSARFCRIPDERITVRKGSLKSVNGD